MFYFLGYRPRILILLFTFIGVQPLMAAIQGVHFYKTPQSLFPSGQVHRKDLEKSELREEWLYSFLVQHSTRRFWLKSEDLLRDIDLAQKVILSKTLQRMSVLQRLGSWLQVEDEKTHHITWMSHRDLRADPEELGLGINVIATSIRTAPKWESELKIMIPALTPLHVVRLVDNWAYVSFQSVGNIEGWVDVSNLVLKADFASFIQDSKGGWRPVKYRDNDELVLDRDERIKIMAVKKLMTKPDVAIVVKKNHNLDLPLRTVVQILKLEADRWALSSLTGHGLVYWKKDIETSSDLTLPMTPTSLHTEELLKAEITSIAFDQRDVSRGILSASGIYLTKNGEDWQKIAMFREQNQPVSFGPNSEIIVGSLWSLDGGKTFVPYVGWEKLGAILARVQPNTTRVLKLQEVSTLPGNRLKLVVDTGLAQHAFVADVKNRLVSNWRIDPTFIK